MDCRIIMSRYAMLLDEGMEEAIFPFLGWKVFDWMAELEGGEA
jgi:hypothetical protein